MSQKKPLREDYQLFYGMDSSFMRSSECASLQNTTSKHCNEHENNCDRAKAYGLMEDSYYEDGLNGNLEAYINLPSVNNSYRDNVTKSKLY